MLSKQISKRDYKIELIFIVLCADLSAWKFQEEVTIGINALSLCTLTAPYKTSCTSHLEVTDCDLKMPFPTPSQFEPSSTLKVKHKVWVNSYSTELILLIEINRPG